MKKTLLMLFVPLFLAVPFSGCRTAFLPVAVPVTSSMRPAPPADESKAEEELRRLQNASPEAYVIAPNDVLNVIVAESTEYGRPVTVMPDGVVFIAPAGPVHVAGMTLTDAAAKIGEKLKKYIREPVVTLEPVTVMKPTFVIAGKVTSPGIYPIIVGYTRVADAIALAGGLATGTGKGGITIDYADLQNSYISRKGKILPVNFRKAVSEGNALHNIPVMNGDYIYIAPASLGNITVLGEAGNTTIPYQPDMTLLQAIAMAGGLQETSSEEVKLIRGGQNRPVVYTVNVGDIQRGKSMDFPLQPLDVIYNPRDGISEFNLWVRKIMPAFQLINTLAGPFGNPATYFYGK